MKILKIIAAIVALLLLAIAALEYFEPDQTAEYCAKAWKAGTICP